MLRAPRPPCGVCGEPVREVSARFCSKKCSGIAHRGRPASNRKHGRSYDPEYRAWQQMRLRCTDPEHAAWDDYGGRGITICAEWLDDPRPFIEHIGPKPSRRHEIDRIDNDRGYEPGNVRWATRSENDRNRRSTRWIEALGKRLPAIAWAERTGIPVQTIYARAKLGWPPERIVSEPAQRRAAPRTVEVDGVVMTAAALGRRLSGRKLVTGRIAHGWDPVEAATTPPHRGVAYELDGQSLTLLELSRLCGLARKTIRGRIERGMSVRDAISTPAANPGRARRAA